MFVGAAGDAAAGRLAAGFDGFSAAAEDGERDRNAAGLDDLENAAGYDDAAGGLAGVDRVRVAAAGRRGGEIDQGEARRIIREKRVAPKKTEVRLDVGIKACGDAARGGEQLDRIAGEYGGDLVQVKLVGGGRVFQGAVQTSIPAYPGRALVRGEMLLDRAARHRGPLHTGRTAIPGWCYKKLSSQARQTASSWPAQDLRQADGW